MNESEPKKDHSVKHKPEQEQTVGLTQVGTLHGELPEMAETFWIKDARELTEIKEVLAWCDENLVAVEHWNGWHIAFHPNHHIYGKTLYGALQQAWKSRGEK